MYFVRGSRKCSAESLFSLCQSFFHHFNSCCFNFSRLEGRRLARSLRFALATIYRLAAMRKAIDRLRIDAIVSLYRDRECTDLRDKVFGFLGLTMGTQVNLITPDYSASVSQTFERTTVQLIPLSEPPHLELPPAPIWSIQKRRIRKPTILGSRLDSIDTLAACIPHPENQKMLRTTLAWLEVPTQ